MSVEPHPGLGELLLIILGIWAVVAIAIAVVIVTLELTTGWDGRESGGLRVVTIALAAGSAGWALGRHGPRP